MEDTPAGPIEWATPQAITTVMARLLAGPLEWAIRSTITTAMAPTAVHQISVIDVIC